MKRIIELENQILQDQIKLNNLMESCEAGQMESITKLKLDRMQQEIGYLNQQMAYLRERYTNQPESVKAAHTVPMQGMPPVQNVPAQQAFVQPPVQKMTMHQTPPVQSQMPVQVPPYPQYQPLKKDVEKTIGKTVMAVCASILIFISIISIATLVIANLSDTMKMVLMFLISIAFTAVGGGLLCWKKENKWFLSLTGCGVGALYISLLCSNLFFDKLSITGLFIGIFVWAVFVCVLSRWRSNVFLIIGQAGTLVSLLFGLLFCLVNKDRECLLMLLVFFLITETIFYLSHYQKKYCKNLVNHIFVTVGFLTLLSGTNAGYMEGTIEGVTASLLLGTTAYVLIMIYMTIFQMESKENIVFGIMSSLLFLTFCWAIGGFFANMQLLLLAVAVITLILLEIWIEKRKYRPYEAGNVCFQIVLFISIYLQLVNVEFWQEYISTVPFVAAFLLYGFLHKNTVYKVAGLIYALLFIFAPINGGLHLFYGAILASGIVILMYLFKEQYRAWIKVVTYIAFQFVLLIDCNRILEEIEFISEDYSGMILWTILSFVNIAVMKVPLLYKDVTGEKEEKGILITTGVINILLMFVILTGVHADNGEILHVWAILLGLVLFFINSWNLVKKYSSGWTSVYVGIKLLVYVLNVLVSFDSPGYLLSIAGLITVLLCIVFGFVAERKMQRNFKAVRIYGLVLALICMLKLMIIDISYESVIMQAVSFFISGLLCFGISFIYHMVDKAIIKK